MADNTLTIECPCCAAKIQIDAKSGKVLFAEEAQVKKDFSFDTQLEQIRKQKDQADQLFSKAFQDEAERKKLLERKFEEAQKRAQEDKGAIKPRRPFDFD
ncbi:MAG TPA: 2-nitropropane dioxygenase [Acidobacteriota bacterium]|jgi:flagellar basal body P-ring protein FlgI